MSQPIVFFAFRSPYSRLGLHKLKRAGIEAIAIPFTGPPDGAPFFNPTDSKPKLEYYLEDIPRMTERMGLPLAFPDPFEIRGDLPLRAFHWADQQGRGFDFALAASEARWGLGKDLASPDVLAVVASELGLDLPGAEELACDKRLDAEMATARQAVQQHGVFGVPFLVADGAKYWGQDRFDIYLETVSG
ncbi:DsbA family protein [Hyphobacterium sp. HN65]|uniref:2-hydroxychromene-2-carboxylate isomerase n=1 Tax=Hyphobacterium lacteum TaxID=3116575 RepID=A0ABU7LRF5_9PROT|nr:DsbA family protein [Hyphobacterium sp. HN65]MEE2526489.1 DsbA family protein [Hyphobacterium sp. HN65]